MISILLQVISFSFGVACFSAGVYIDFASISSTSEVCKVENYVQYSGTCNTSNCTTEATFASELSFKRISKLAAGGNAIAAILSQIVGITMYPRRFSLWQPFQGGKVYLLLQIFGWSIFATSSMLFLITGTSNRQLNRGNGIMAATGCAALASTLILLRSIQSFDPRAKPLSFKIVKKDNMVIIACSVSAIIQAVVIDANIDKLANYLHGLSDYVLITSNIATGLAVLLGYSKVSWHVFVPLSSGGFDFIVLQGSGWLGTLLSAYLHCWHYNPDTALSGVITAITVLYSVSTIVLVVSLDSFVANKNSRSAAQFLSSAPVGATGALIVATLSLVTVICFDFLERIDRIEGILSMIILGISTPVQHFIAHRHINSYRLWQPFAGGTLFVLLCGMSWGTFTISAIFLLFSAVNNVITMASVAGFCMLISCILHYVANLLFTPPVILDACSLLVTSEDEEESNQDGELRRSNTDLRAGNQQLHGPKRQSKNVVLNGEFVTSALITTGAVVTSIYMEFSSHPYLPKHQLALLSVISIIVGPFLAHFSGTKCYTDSYKVFQPFIGGVSFICLQAFAWTMMGLNTGFQIVLLINWYIDPDSVIEGASLASVSFGAIIHVMISFSLTAYIPESGALDKKQSSVTYAVGIMHREITKMSECIVANVMPSELSNLRQEAGRLAGLSRNEYISDILTIVRQKAELKDKDVGQVVYYNDISPGLTIGFSIGALFFMGNAELLYMLLPTTTRSFYAVVLVLMATAMSIFSVFLVHFVTGPRRYPGRFIAWMPLNGGTDFVVLQSAAWFIFILNLLAVASLLYIFSQKMTLLRGSITLVSFLCSAPSLIMLVSIRYFNCSKISHSSDTPNFLQRNGAWTVACLMTIGSTLTFVLIKKFRWVLFITAGRYNYQRRGEHSDWGNDAFFPVITICQLNAVMSIPTAWISVLRARHTTENTYFSTVYESFMICFVFHCFVRYLMNISESLGSAYNQYWWGGMLIFVAGLSHIAAVITLLYYEQGRSLRNVRKDIVNEVAVIILYYWPVFGSALLLLLTIFLDDAASTFFCMIGMMSSCAVACHEDKDTRLIGKYISKALLILGFILACWHRTIVSIMIALISMFYVNFSSYTFSSPVGCVGAKTAQGHGTRLLKMCVFFILRVLSNCAAAHYNFQLQRSPHKPHVSSTTTRRPTTKTLYVMAPATSLITALWMTQCQAWRSYLKNGGYIDKVSTIRDSCQIPLLINSFLLKIPIVRDILEVMDVYPLSCSTVEESLRRSGSVIVVQEGIPQWWGTSSIFKRKRAKVLPTIFLDGRHEELFRIVINCQADIIPIVPIGERDLTHETPWVKLQEWVAITTGMHIPIPSSSSILSIIPLRRTIHLLVASDPIYVEDYTPEIRMNIWGDGQRTLHEVYCRHVAALVMDHKETLQMPDLNVQVWV